MSIPIIRLLLIALAPHLSDGQTRAYAEALYATGRPALIMAIVERESRWRPDVVSRSGCVGLGQLCAPGAPREGAANILDAGRLLDAWRRRCGAVRRAVHGYQGWGGCGRGRSPRAVDSVIAHAARLERAADALTAEVTR